MIIRGCILFITLLVIGSAGKGIGDEQRVRELLQKKVKELRENSHRVTVTDADLVAADKDHSVLLSEVQSLVKDPNEQVRDMAYGIEWDLARNADKPSRAALLEHMSYGLLDPSSLVCKTVTKCFLTFGPSDFTDKSRANIRSMLSKSDRLAGSVMLVGASEQRSEITALKELRKKHQDSGRVGVGDGWFIRLALARLGSGEDIDYCIQKIQSCKEDIEVVTKLTHHLAYMRQPQAVRELGRITAFGKPLPSVVDYSTVSGPMPYEYTLPVLANTVKGFPLPAKDSYSQDDMKKAIDWINSRESFQFVEATASFELRF